jgi:hypothetical protein
MLNSLDYSALVTLAAVLRLGSFDRAATELHVTPSAISQRIKPETAQNTGVVPLSKKDRQEFISVTYSPPLRIQA